jgi:hypothetical protein
MVSARSKTPSVPERVRFRTRAITRTVCLSIKRTAAVSDSRSRMACRSLRCRVIGKDLGEVSCAERNSNQADSETTRRPSFSSVLASVNPASTAGSTTTYSNISPSRGPCSMGIGYRSGVVSETTIRPRNGLVRSSARSRFRTSPPATQANLPSSTIGTTPYTESSSPGDRSPSRSPASAHNKSSTPQTEIPASANPCSTRPIPPSAPARACESSRHSA